MPCHITEEVLGRHLRAITLSNDLISTTVLVDKGADIYRLSYLPAGVDVLWKAPWGLREPGSGFAPTVHSEVAWMEHYAGGWQVLFPNAGNACTYKGVELPFHGEASTLPWQAEILASGPSHVSIRLSVRLFRSPFHLERTMTITEGSPSLTLAERITNESAEPLAAMWVHHPAFGAPFLTPACHIDTGAKTISADAAYDTPGGRVLPGGRWIWPHATTRSGEPVDLSLVPEQGDAMLYLSDFTDGWCAITNPDLGFGLALIWPCELFPYAWFWQEFSSSSGYPWYSRGHTMAIEPASSIPGLGLQHVIENTGNHLNFAPGATKEFTLSAVFFPASASERVAHVSPTGVVSFAPS